ncbi:MAG: transketolase family protein [Candidatus Pacebacteria bacterium]|nr:transketolase family protein [Candidatus Paceibacterota bacterium]
MSNQELKSTRDGFGEAIVALAETNQQIVALTADLTESLRLKKFEEIFPGRFVQVGIAEQNMIGVAAGLALGGKIPFATSFAAFSPGRTWEQIRDSVCYSDLPVIVVGGHAGLNVGEDGYTQQGLEDIALMRVLPNMIVVSPVDFNETKKAVFALAQLKKPAYLRLTREKTLGLTQEDSPFEIGKANLLSLGTDLTIIGSGPILAEAYQAANQLRDNYSIEIINLHTIKPVDTTTIIDSLNKTQAFITIEEHQLIGGVAAAITQALAKDIITSKLLALPHKFLGLNDAFGESGKPVELWQKHGLDSQSIKKTIVEIIEQKKNQR